MWKKLSPSNRSSLLLAFQFLGFAFSTISILVYLILNVANIGCVK
jgi:hypothetical protein